MAAGNSGPVRLFRRFFAEDPAAVAREIEADRVRLDAVQRAGDTAQELALVTGMGFGCYVTGREAEAAPLLERAVALARELGDRRAEIEALLHLATALQYLDRRDTAQALFAEGLALSAAHGIPEFDHFILAHQGRCYAEQGDFRAARSALEAALALRQKLGEETRIRKIEALLAELAEWEAEVPPPG